ncbi:MAG: HNH endonuclease [Gemmatimonadaceae bacterium]
MKKRTYDFSNRLRKGFTCTKVEIVDSLKEFAREKKKATFTQRQYDAWKRRILCSSQTAVRFGGWSNAMERAGLEPVWKPAKSGTEMVELFMDCWEEHDDFPTEKVFATYLKKIGSTLTINVYKHRFGGLRRLAQRVVDFHAGRISESQFTENHVKIGATRKQISAKVRYEIFARDSFRCTSCGRRAQHDGVKLEVDHKMAVARGGTDDMANLQTLCTDCNRGKCNSLSPSEIEINLSMQQA